MNAGKREHRRLVNIAEKNNRKNEAEILLRRLSDSSEGKIGTKTLKVPERTNNKQEK